MLLGNVHTEELVVSCGSKGKNNGLVFGGVNVNDAVNNLTRAKELDPTVTELTEENAGELIDRAGGVQVRVRATCMQKFTDLLLAQGASVTSSGKVVEKAAVARKDGGEGGSQEGSGSENGNGGNGGGTTPPDNGGENEE